MKVINILNGRCLVVELPEGAETVHVAYNNGFWHLIYFTHNGEILTRKRLPKGNWRIIGMLSEVRELEAATLVESRRKLKDWGFTASYGTYYFNYSAKPVYAEFDTALESLESAILAEGYVFGNKLINPDDVCYFSRDRMIADVREYHEAQSRVLDRSRCLLLGREGV